MQQQQHRQLFKKCKVSLIEMNELDRKAKAAKEHEEEIQGEIDMDEAEVGPEIIGYESMMYYLKNIVECREFDCGEPRVENKIELKVKKLHDEIVSEYHSKWEAYEQSRLSKMCTLRTAISERNTAVLNRYDATLDDV
jgi:hypothetical protein